MNEQHIFELEIASFKALCTQIFASENKISEEDIDYLCAEDDRWDVVAGLNWDQITVEHFSLFEGDLFLMPIDAKVYFLPAILILILQNPLKSGGMITSLIAHIDEVRRVIYKDSSIRFALAEYAKVIDVWCKRSPVLEDALTVLREINRPI